MIVYQLLSQSTFLPEALTATPSFPSLSSPESSSPLELPPMYSRSMHACCMSMGGSSQLTLLQVAEHLTLFKECCLDIITGSNQNALMLSLIHI